MEVSREGSMVQSAASSVLTTPSDVVRCLLTYIDWWQPASGSIVLVGGARRDKGMSDGIHPGLLGHLDERTELCRRTAELKPKERRVLHLWYVAQLPVEDIAKQVGASMRHCFRIRSHAVRRIVELGDPEKAA